MYDKELLLQRINERDARAYHILYRDYYKSLVVYAMNYVPKSEDAEDIVQELFTCIYERNIHFISYASFNGYIYNAVRNAALNHIKHLSIEERYATSLFEEEVLLGGVDDEDDFITEEDIVVFSC